eukprot:Lithocolla_globosa_v1_NODE_8472_length_817_cov_17.792651.p2 type:complete len:144 gc:universal NODE_8472_length_817_cov_17.792651:262-693(+)
MSPKLSMTYLSSAAEIPPSPSLSKILNACFNSSSHCVTVALTFGAIINRNSLKSTLPSPSLSTLPINRVSSDSVGNCPSVPNTTCNSRSVMVPSPSVSNKEKASLSSLTCLGVRSSTLTSGSCSIADVSDSLPDAEGCVYFTY